MGEAEDAPTRVVVQLRGEGGCSQRCRGDREEQAACPRAPRLYLPSELCRAVPGRCLVCSQDWVTAASFSPSRRGSLTPLLPQRCKTEPRAVAVAAVTGVKQRFPARAVFARGENGSRARCRSREVAHQGSWVYLSSELNSCLALAVRSRR